jgi:hypothetical protein
MMRTLRRMVSWCFLVEAILCLGWTAWSLHSLIFTRDTAGSYAQEFVAIALTGVFGFGAWALRLEQAARKGWVIAASLLNLLLSMGQLLFYGRLRLHGFHLHPGFFMHTGRPHILPMILGLVGFFVILRERSVPKFAPETSS